MLLTFAYLSPVRSRSPWLLFSRLLCSVRALGGPDQCSFTSLPYQSLPSRCLFPPPSSLLYPLQRYRRLFLWPGTDRRFCVTCVVIGVSIAPLLNFSFLILSFIALPWMLIICIKWLIDILEVFPRALLYNYMSLRLCCLFRGADDFV